FTLKALSFVIRKRNGREAMAKKIEQILLSPTFAIALGGVGIAVATVAYFTMTPESEPPKKVLKATAFCDARTVYRQKKLLEASHLITQGKWKAAEEILKRLAMVMPKNSVVFSNLAYTQKKMHKYENAEMNLKKAIELEPGQWVLYHNLGMLYFEKNSVDNAI